MNKSGWFALVSVLVVGCAPSSSGSVDYATRVRGCATSLACYQREPMGSCVRPFGAEALALLPCFAAANGDCDAALRCVHVTAAPDPSCTEYSSACEGETLVACTPASDTAVAVRFRLDCAASGEVCFAEGGSAGCVEGTCSGTGVRCLDGDILRCDAGHEYRTVCGEGTTCSAAGGGTCVPDGPPCTESRCEGNVLVYCGGNELRFDCADYGRTCGVGDFGADCIATATECDPDTFSERCAGGVLEFCSPNGNIDRFDCDANGFDGCAGPPAHCVPRGFAPIGT